MEKTKYTVDYVREQNDKFRKSLVKTPMFRVVLTAGVADSQIREKIIETVRLFDSFSDANDPHKEHDCALFDLDGIKYMFKFDYYDKNLEYGVDPLEDEPYRVLTIMQASER